MTEIIEKKKVSQCHKLCVAPMIDWTDRYCRFFHRQLAPNARLYTEMIVDEALLHGDRDRLLGFDPVEHPVALQIGGSDPDKLARAAEIGAAYGYDEINMNVGCPSDRVQSGRFGACLMAEPQLVADAVVAMRGAVSVPVTVKCRIGIDDQDPSAVLPGFCDAVIAAGATTIIVHARKAWLKGLSPKENRTIPPLDYQLVAEVSAARPSAAFILNGGLTEVQAIAEETRRFAGVMIGRAAYETPMVLADADRALFRAGEGALPNRIDVVDAVCAKAEAMGVPLWGFARHMLGLFHGRPGARGWRRTISEDGPSGRLDTKEFRALAARVEALSGARDEDAA